LLKEIYMKFKPLALVFLSLILAGCERGENTRNFDSKEAAHGEANESYYTCSMHPQVHEHKPGTCPICGMPLIKVSGHKEKNSQKNSILPTDYQKKVVQLTQGKVERKEISFEISTGGRLLNSSQVAFYIYESELMRVKVGQSFEGECSSMPGVIILGKISQIDTVADPSSRSVRVVGNISSAHNMKLMEGSFFGKIKTSAVSTLIIPYDAVLRTGDRNIVYKIQDSGNLIPVSVILGLSKDDTVEVLKGLDEGDIISFGPNFLIDSESRLKGNAMSNMEGM
jgi:hypothetical protein